MGDPWIEGDICMRYAEEIWAALRGRSGFDFEIEGDTMQEIKNEIAETIRKARDD